MAKKVRKKREIKRCISVQESFSENTSIHGLKYVAGKNIPFKSRITWVLAFCLANAFSLYMIFKIYNQWNRSPIRMTFDSAQKTISEVDFPSVTLCNNNKLSAKKFAMEMDSPRGRDLQHIGVSEKDIVGLVKILFNLQTSFQNEDFLQSIGEKMKAHNETVLGATRIFELIVAKSQVSCDDMMPYCQWEDVDFKCSILFRRLTLTEEGWCCTVDWKVAKQLGAFDSVDKRRIDFSSKLHGSGSGLTIYFDYDFDDYKLPFNDFDGVKVLIHEQDEIPLSSSPWVVAPPSVTASISIRAINTAGGRNINILPPSRRFCGFKDEYGFSYGNKANPGTACGLNRAALRMLKECGCKPLYMLITSIQMKSCPVTLYPCLAKVLGDPDVNKIDECLPTCDDIRYSVTTRNTELVTDAMNAERIAILSGKQKYKNATYNRLNFSRLKIYFGRPEVDQFVRQLRYTWEDFASSVGGLLSLGCGFSVISIFEFFYLILVRPRHLDN